MPPPPKLQTEAYAPVRRLQRIRSEADREAAEGAAATATGTDDSRMVSAWEKGIRALPKKRSN